MADKIRDLLAKTDEAKRLQLKKNTFSSITKPDVVLVVKERIITLAMNVMGTVNQTCPECNGKRFKPEVLQVHWNNKNIAEIYHLSLAERMISFSMKKKLSEILALMLV